MSKTGYKRIYEHHGAYRFVELLAESATNSSVTTTELSARRGGQALGASALNPGTEAWLRNVQANHVIGIENPGETPECLSHDALRRVSRQGVAKSDTLHGVQGVEGSNPFAPTKFNELGGPRDAGL